MPVNNELATKIWDRFAFARDNGIITQSRSATAKPINAFT